jgi:hypothetical protein
MKQHLVIITVAALLTASCDWNTRWQSGGFYPYNKMLTLKGGVPDETLKRTGE